jgi:hypothetical protein
MYILATTSKYEAGTQYYTKSGDTYTLFTNYSVGDDITGTKYEAVKHDRLYIRKYGVTTAYKQFPYKIAGINTLPEHDGGANDVDLDAYTNTKGKTIRNRVRHDVATLDFKVPTMTGKELHNFFNETKYEWLDCLFFYESEWEFVSKKMYRSGTVSYHIYYVNDANPDKNIYTDVSFQFIEQ